MLCAVQSGHQSELRRVEAAHASEVACLGAQLQRSRDECEQLGLRVLASQEVNNINVWYC